MTASQHGKAVAMQVPLLDLRSQYAGIAEPVMARIAEICSSQQFILGRHVSGFEIAAAAYCRSAHAIGVSSGTDALLLALMALNIGPGDEVVTTPFTFFATAGTIARVGARPVFCDIDPVSFNVCPQAVRRYLERECDRRDGALVSRRGGRVRALMPVHLYGRCADNAALQAIASEFGLDIIEDAAQAIGADDERGGRAGSVGRVGCLSFFPTKNLGAFGDAGMCVTQDAALADHMRVLRVHGGQPKYYHAYIGGNFRLDEIQAAVLEVKLPHLDAWTEARARNAAHYSAAIERRGLEARVRVPRPAARGRHVWNQYVVRAERRDELRQFLAERGVGTEIYYPVPLHLQQCFAGLGHARGDFPEAERAAAEVLALPIFPELRAEQLDHVVDSLAAFYS